MVRFMIGSLFLREPIQHDDLYVTEKIIARVIFSPKDKRDSA